MRKTFVGGVLAALVFTWLAFRVSLDGVPPFDTEVRNAIHSVATSALTTALKFITWFGSGWLLCPLGIVLVWALMNRNRRRDAAIFTAAVLGAEILDEGMKLLFHRPRPDAFFDYPQPLTYSFPSGHAFISATFYLTLAELLIPPEWAPWRRAIAWVLAILTTAVIGLSRVYLGVHYPTDVLAGYAGAIAWTSIVRAAHRRRWHTPGSNRPSALEQMHDQ